MGWERLVKQVIVAALVSAGIVFGLGEMFIARASADRVLVELETCQYEDGNPSGEVCLWIDADTGDGYIVTSENYR